MSPRGWARCSAADDHRFRSDGGNAHHRDSQRRGRSLAENGIGFVDAGVSGGVWGLDQGYGLMLGGTREQVDAILP
ncbi:MAG: NAD(P)-binding domain-containing protein [Gammaproteobacteria bacterium]